MSGSNVDPGKSKARTLEVVCSSTIQSTHPHFHARFTAPEEVYDISNILGCLRLLFLYSLEDTSAMGSSSDDSALTGDMLFMM